MRVIYAAEHANEKMEKMKVLDIYTKLTFIKYWLLCLTIFRMGLSGAAHRWWGQKDHNNDQNQPSLVKILW